MAVTEATSIIIFPAPDINVEADVVFLATEPSAGMAITAGFEFDVRVRFDTDIMDVTLDLERLSSITSIPLMEIRR